MGQSWVIGVLLGVIKTQNGRLCLLCFIFTFFLLGRRLAHMTLCYGLCLYALRRFYLGLTLMWTLEVSDELTTYVWHSKTRLVTGMN